MSDEIKESKAPSKRHLNRVAAMQFIYSMDLNPPVKIDDACRIFFEGLEKGRDYYLFSEELIYGYYEKRDDVDAAIQERAANWSFDRIAKVDLAILRLAIYELLFREDIPPVVTINEAIDLSKEFSSDDSRRFVNGILDEIKKTLNRPDRKAKS